MRTRNCLLVFALWAAATTDAHDFLVGNTRADNVVEVSHGLSVTEFISGVPSPDHLVYYENTLYLSAGDTAENSAVYSYDDDTLSVFAEGGGLMRPYGFAFDGGILYVASFMTDQILTYNASTGEYIDVFAETDGTEEGLCNGPNHIAIHDGMLYLTTQGSNVINDTLTYLFASQIVKYDLATGTGEVFAAPEAMPGGLGFVSMLGCQVYCEDGGDCMLVTTDFAGGLRMYMLDGALVYAAETTYTAGAATGALSIYGAASEVYVTGFFNETTPGVVMRFDLASGDPKPTGLEGAIYLEDEALVRPIGILLVPEDTEQPEPTSASTFCGVWFALNLFTVYLALVPP